MNHKRIDFYVGLFMVLAALSLVFMALKVSGLALNQQLFGSDSYRISASFNDIGDLKIRAPVRVAGVQIGKVISISLNKTTYEAKVGMLINGKIDNLPTDSSVSVEKSSLLGDNYISITPGYSQASLKPGGKITTTYSATSLQSLISTFMNSGKK